MKKFIIVIVISLTVGCTGFLAEKPSGSLTDQVEFSGGESLDALKRGPYRSLPKWVGGAGDWGNYLPATIEYLTGKSYTEDAHVQLWRYQTDQVTGDLLDNFNNIWNNWFDGVRDCNMSIEKVATLEGVSTADKARALGEIRTLRAWYYFNLVRYFGDVPLISIGLPTLEDDIYPERHSLKSIYDNVIIPDLVYAVDTAGLTEARSADGHITRDISRVILADVYLTCAGYPYQEVSNDPGQAWCVDGLWKATQYPVATASATDFLQKAKTQLDALYGKYALGTYRDLNNPSSNNSGENIFQAQFMSGVLNNSIIPAALPFLSQISMFGDDYGTFVPSPAYVASYNQADKRIQDRQMFFYRDIKSKKYDPTESVEVVFSTPHLYKFYDESAVKGTGTSGLNWTFYRYADVLLMLTEVNWTLRASGVAVSDHDIEKGINEVRSRAELPPLSAGDMSLFNILSERAYELVFENKMLWDMRRTRKALVDGEGSFTRLENLVGHRPEGYSYSFSAKHLLSPISAREIQNNDNVKQNFGHLPQ